MSEIVQAAAKKPEAKRENRVSQIQKTDFSQSISSPVEQILFLQRTIGNQAVGRLIESGALQAKLKIGQPDDIYEQEANRMAEQVMRMPEPHVANETKVSNPARNNPIQRKCPRCNKGTKIEREEEEEKLQKKEASGPTHEVTPELESSISAFHGGGQPLSESTRTFYEPRFGADFGQVRVHTGSHASETAKLINARAFTVGNNIAFDGGQFALESQEGRKLLAHELAHTIQQGVTNTLQKQCSTSSVVQPKKIKGSDPILSLDRAASGPVCQGPQLDQEDIAQGLCIAPTIPPKAPICLPMGVDVDIPAIDEKGAQDGVRKQRIEFEDPILDSPAVVLYAVPRWVVADALDPSVGICDPRSVTDDQLARGLGLAPFGSPPAGTFMPALTPGLSQPTKPVLPELGVLSLRGDYIITTRYTTFAVGAGSVRVVQTQNGITLIDAGVGPQAHNELTQAVLEQLDVMIGDLPINEVLLSHLHKDHTSLLPELARKYRIGKVRINAFQLHDPRMIAILKRVAYEQAGRVARQVRATAEANRAAWEINVKSGVLSGDKAIREARWNDHVDQLIDAELARSAIRLETLFVNDKGELHVAESPLLGDLVLPKTKTAPVLLEKGLLEESAISGGPRISTAHPKIARDLDDLIDRQAKAARIDPNAKITARNEDIDANEATYVIEFSGGARLFVTPDKRVPDIASIKDLLESDVKALNAELKRLGRESAKLQVWDVGHHAQRGFVIGISEMKSLIASLQLLTRVKQASGTRTMDIVIVSGQGDPTNPAVTSLVDPLTVWLLREIGIEVFIATSKQSVEMLEVLLHEGGAVAGVVQEPYKTSIPSKGTLRRSQEALNEIEVQISQLKKSRPTRQGMPAAEYQKNRKEINAQIESLKKLRTAIKNARDAYFEYYEAKLRPAGGKPVQTIPVDDKEAEARRSSLEALLVDKRIEGAVYDAEPRAPRFDPVALTLLKRSTGGLTDAQIQIAEAIMRVDALRERLRVADAIDTRAEFAKELTALKPLLAKYIETAPPGSKELFEGELKSIDQEIGQVTKPTPGAGDIVTSSTPEGGFSVEQRTRFEKPTGGERVRALADLTTRPLGAIMIYSLVKKQRTLEQGLDDDTIDLPEYLIGMAHTAYGITVGVRMLQKVHVSNTEFAILAVIDVFETASHHYASDAERNAAITYSIVRNGLQLGLFFVGTKMMTSKNGWIAAAGFLLQFAVDPFLEWIGLYSWFERKYDFLPDDVVRVRQKIRTLMQQYTVLIGLLELSQRSSWNLGTLNRGDDNASTRIHAEINDYRSKVMGAEGELLSAFKDGYETVKTSYAGLPELDTMRAQFLELQFRAHQDDIDHTAESRQHILDTFHWTEGRLSLDDMSAEAIRDMKQWSELDNKLDCLDISGALLGKNSGFNIDWKAIFKTESELEQMLDNARYRLDPMRLGLRSTPILSPGTEAYATYERELTKREEHAAKVNERLLYLEQTAATTDLLEAAIMRADRVVAAHKSALGAMPPFQGLNPQRLQDSSLDLGKGYEDYINAHSDYRDALYKLQTIELMMQSTVARMDALAVPAVSASASSMIASRVKAVHDATIYQMRDRIQREFLFSDEAKQRSVSLRSQENQDIAARLGEKGVKALSTPERTAINERDLPLSTGATIIDRLNAMPMLSRVGSDGYMVGVYRYVDQWVPDTANALVGDLRRTTEVPDPFGDGTIKVHLYVPITESALKLLKDHFIIFGDPIIGRSPYADVPPGSLAFDDDDVNKLKKLNLEELKP